MSLAVVHSRALTAASAPEVTVEVHLANGLPAFSIVGLPELEVRESRERVRAALQNSGFTFPVRRITVNLAPADLPKQSGHFDLPIALGILVASEQLPAAALHTHEFAGELSLTGALRPMRGAFAMACGLAAQAAKANPAPATPVHLYLPLGCAAEAALVPTIAAFGAPDLRTLCAHLAGLLSPPLLPLKPVEAISSAILPDMADIIGQSTARRALEVAAAGAHHILMIGPPGSGKSMLATRLASILPPMSNQEALASAALLSAALGFTPAQWRCRPFRAPHHSATATALVGGGNPPRPGEITLAHHGVLFLDELPEFNRCALEMLREPLETSSITLSRASHQAEFPAACQLIAAMNPCPCGWLGDPNGRCHCSPENTARYWRKLSGPLLDRIDLHIEVPALTPAELAERTTLSSEASATVAARVVAARSRQLTRQQQPNRFLSGREIDTLCKPDPAGETLLRSASSRFGWSTRTYYSVLKVARTIADLADVKMLDASHIAEAIQYRRVFK